jgi:hypothetical protein
MLSPVLRVKKKDRSTWARVHVLNGRPKRKNFDVPAARILGHTIKDPRPRASDAVSLGDPGDRGI